MLRLEYLLARFLPQVHTHQAFSIRRNVEHAGVCAAKFRCCMTVETRPHFHIVCQLPHTLQLSLVCGCGGVEIQSIIVAGWHIGVGQFIERAAKTKMKIFSVERKPLFYSNLREVFLGGSRFRLNQVKLRKRGQVGLDYNVLRFGRLFGLILLNICRRAVGFLRFRDF